LRPVKRPLNGVACILSPPEACRDDQPNAIDVLSKGLPETTRRLSASWVPPEREFSSAERYLIQCCCADKTNGNAFDSKTIGIGDHNRLEIRVLGL